MFSPWHDTNTTRGQRKIRRLVVRAPFAWREASYPGAPRSTLRVHATPRPPRQSPLKLIKRTAVPEYLNCNIYNVNVLYAAL